jgi:hypothetical protein
MPTLAPSGAPARPHRIKKKHAPPALYATLRLHVSHATAAGANPPLHASAPTLAVVRLMPADAHLMPTDTRFVHVDAHAGGDRYARGNHICMCPLPTPTNIATWKHFCNIRLKQVKHLQTYVCNICV